MKRWPSLFLILGFLVLVCSCDRATGVPSTPSSTTMPPTPPLTSGTMGSRIAFVDKYDNIVVINPDGSGQKTLTHTTWGDHSPRWSPDGRKIAFISKRDGNPEIYIMNTDGTGQKRLTTNPGKDLDPQWAPDSQTIALVSNREGKWQVYLMSSDGSNQRRLTTNSYEELWPTWSPDGKRIAFAAHEDNSNTWEIQVVDTDGSNKLVLAENWLGVEDLTWSPDGRWIAFTADIGDNLYRLKIVSSDGSSIQEIRIGSWVDAHPLWSPQSDKVAFISIFHGKDGQHLIIADVENKTWMDLTDDMFSWGFSWSPDGKQLAYMSDSQKGIWIINSDGSGQPVFLVDGRDPQWSP